MTLPSGLSVGSAAGVVFGVYTSRELFTPRPEFVRASNRSGYVVGSVVVAAHFQGELGRTDLNVPARITFSKFPEVPFPSFPCMYMHAYELLDLNQSKAVQQT